MKKWKPPLKCRLFGHKWEDEFYEVESAISPLMSATIRVCEHCKGGEMETLLRKISGTPEQIAIFKEEFYIRFNPKKSESNVLSFERRQK